MALQRAFVALMGSRPSARTVPTTGDGPVARADRRAQRPGLIMAAIYRTLLREIAPDRFQVLDQRTSLTPLRKLWIAARTQWRGR